MIGHWLLTLTPEREERLLTQIFAPMWHEPNSSCVRCMVLVAMDWAIGNPATGIDEADVRDRQSPPGYNHSPGWRYEHLCERFGASRVNAAIRNRILSNRARRVLATVRDTSLVETQK